MHRTLLRWFFALLLPVLVLQYAYCLKVNEPYPAFIMPSFSGSDAATSGRARTELIELHVFAEEEVLDPEMQYDDLLHDVRHEFRRNVMLHSFSPPPRSYIREQYRAGLNQWVKERCIAHVKRDDLTRLEVHYVLATWDLTQQPPTIISQETTATHVIPFE